MKALFEVDDARHGRGAVRVRWQRDGGHVASCGANGLVQILDRHGRSEGEVALSSSAAVIALEWCKDGEVLAVLQERVGSVALYDVGRRKLTQLETGLKDPRFLCWSRTGPQLAVGSGNGTLLLYRKDTLRQETFVGKHSGAITCGAWSEVGNTLALGSEDNTVSLSSCEGHTEEQFRVRAKPVAVQWAPPRPVEAQGAAAGSGGGKSWLVGVSTRSESLALFCAGESAAVEMQFQSRYGKLVNFGWLSNAELAVGFSNGHVVAVSAKQGADFGAELFSERLHRTSLADLVVSRALGRVASCGDSTVRVIDCATWKELKADQVTLEHEEGQLDQLSWTVDGQILSVATKTGRVYNFLTKMPMVHSCRGAHIAYLSNLREISVINALDMQRGVRATPIKVQVETEPNWVALGDEHLAVGINNRAWFYRWQGGDGDGRPQLVREHEFLASIDALELNGQYCAALCGGKVYLQGIERTGGSSSSRSSNNNNNSKGGATMVRVFPEPGCPDATCVALTPTLLIYGSTGGTLELFSLVDGKPIAGSELRHETAVTRVYPNALGTRVIFMDACRAGFLFNPVDSQCLPVPDLSADTATVLWDQADPNVFVCADARELSTYVYAPLTINGPCVTKVGPLEVRDNGDLETEPLSTQLPAGFQAIVSFAGIVTCQAPSSQLTKVMLGSHEALHSQERSEQAARARFCQSLALRKLNDAWKQALLFADQNRSHWLALSGRAMEEMNVEIAARVWRKLGDAGMVMALERLRFVEDKYLLAGSVAALFGDYAQAQELYLLSPTPEAALTMRKDLLHWEQALKLAEKVAPEQIPSISVKLAQQLEFKGEYKASLEMYQAAMDGFLQQQQQQQQQRQQQGLDQQQQGRLPLPRFEGGRRSGKDKIDVEHEEKDREEAEAPKSGASSLEQRQCLAGITRMTLRVGNIPKGVALAIDSKDLALCRECAEILVSLKQFADAATLFEKAEQWEDAASIHIKAKNFSAAAPLLARVTAPKLHLQMAQAKEAERDYKTAMAEYEAGKDLESVVRIALEHLKQPEKAFAIVRKNQSAVGAELAARYCRSVNDFKGAIEFLLLAKRGQEALELATAHDCMDVFEQALGAEGSPEEYHAIAKFYESKQANTKAAECYAICGQFHKALKLHLAGNEIEKAIAVVGKAKSDMLTHTLIDFLMGETTGVVQNPVHIFQLYMALGNYSQAARTAMVIAHQERETGNYRAAHSILYETHRELEQRNIRVPQALRQTFLLLHSYLLVKRRVKVDDHAGAARLLSRVAKNISKFPSHTVPILTSAVIECQRGGLKATAFEYATELMRPERRNELAQDYRRKIEAIVRKRGGEVLEDAPDGRTLSPYAGEMVDNFELVCPASKNQIPFCCVTGRHMVAEDWCFCPNSKLPALYSEYVAYLNAVKTPEERVDPVLGKPVSAHELRRTEDLKAYLDAYSAAVEEEDEAEEQPQGAKPHAAQPTRAAKEDKSPLMAH